MSNSALRLLAQLVPRDRLDWKSSEASSKKIAKEFELQLKQAEKESVEQAAQNKKLYEQMEKMMEEKSALKREKDEMKLEMQKTLEEKEHQILTSKILAALEKGDNLTDLITRAAILRKSLG